MSDYNLEQLFSLQMVRRHLDSLSERQKQDLLKSSKAYLDFRREVDRFLQRHFASTCSRQCYRSRLSACCTREGIVTFFADVVVNALRSSSRRLDLLEQVLQHPANSFKCVYLGPNGCLWRVKPIVCQMFLCDRAMNQVFAADPRSKVEWERLKEHKLQFTWPDQPVLFDDLEKLFLDAGYTSPLMYLHNSPGLIRVKQKNRM